MSYGFNCVILHTAVLLKNICCVIAELGGYKYNVVVSVFLCLIASVFYFYSFPNDTC